MIDRDLLNLIDVEEMLNELGLRNVRNNYNGEIQYSCPFSGHSHLDTSPSASMSTEPRPAPDGGEYPPTTFYCFGCGKKGTAINFLAEYEGVSVITAKRFLRERFAGDVDDIPEGELVAMVKAIQAPKEKKTLARSITILDEKELDDRAIDWQYAYSLYEEQGELPEPFAYMFDRGFSAETLLDWDIGYDEISKRISIPARNENGELVGFKGRAWWPDAQPRYLALGGDKFGFEPYEVSRILFGLDKVDRFTNTLVVREGELNAIALHQLGVTNAVGISGKKVSRAQVNLIRKYCGTVYFWFDDMDDSIEAANKLLLDMRVIIVPAMDKDPVDLLLQTDSAGIVNNSFLNAKSALTIGLASVR